jgi:hypothetical protein
MLTRRNFHRWCLALNHLPDRAIIWVLTGLACANEIPEFGIVTQGAEVIQQSFDLWNLTLDVCDRLGELLPLGFILADLQTSGHNTADGKEQEQNPASDQRNRASLDVGQKYRRAPGADSRRAEKASDPPRPRLDPDSLTPEFAAVALLWHAEIIRLTQRYVR